MLKEFKTSRFFYLSLSFSQAQHMYLHSQQFIPIDRDEVLIDDLTNYGKEMKVLLDFGTSAETPEQ
jgi:hypothetical protein